VRKIPKKERAIGFFSYIENDQAADKSRPIFEGFEPKEASVPKLLHTMA